MPSEDQMKAWMLEVVWSTILTVTLKGATLFVFLASLIAAICRCTAQELDSQ